MPILRFDRTDTLCRKKQSSNYVISSWLKCSLKPNLFLARRLRRAKNISGFLTRHDISPGARTSKTRFLFFESAAHRHVQKIISGLIQFIGHVLKPFERPNFSCVKRTKNQVLRQILVLRTGDRLLQNSLRDDAGFLAIGFRQLLPCLKASCVVL